MRARTAVSFGDFLGMRAPVSTRTIHQEVFQDEPAFATMKRPAAVATSELLVRQCLIRFDTHKLIPRAAVRALEPRYLGNGHDAGKVERNQSTSLNVRSANVGAGIVADRSL
jgi:hypothetical protein